MARSPIWRTIKADLTSDIAEGRFTTGDQLPTETQLAARFGVNRHTVRRALAEMSNEGLILSRRGAGVFVAASPTDYAIGRRVRFHQNVEGMGRSASKQALSITQQSAGQREAEMLHIAPGAPVAVYDGLSLVDDHVIAVFCSIFPIDPLPGIMAALQANSSVTAALALCDVLDYTRVNTRITAKAATATQALHLRVAEGAPILRTVGINIDAQGRPVEYGRTWFAGDRVTLTVGEE